jgi:hypothetical protein
MNKDHKHTMNTTLKATLALGAAGLSLLALAGGANAQITTGDPNLSTVFSTITAGRNPIFGSGSTTQKVGFDPSGNVSVFATTPATAQSVYEPFVFDTSAAGTFNTVAAGSLAQIQLFASNFNVNQTAGNPQPFNLYASLFAFNPNAAAGTVPVTGPNLFGGEQKVTLGSQPSFGTFFSGDFTLAGPITAGNTYVLGISTLSNDTQDFATVSTAPFSITGISAADQATDAMKFLTNTNDQGNPAGQPAVAGGGNNVIAFRLAAANPAPAVPEASSVVSMGLLLGMGAALIAFKRRRSVAK